MKTGTVHIISYQTMMEISPPQCCAAAAADADAEKSPKSSNDEHII